MWCSTRIKSDEFARIVPASDKAARCVVAKNHLTLYLDHFSEWWIISLIRRYFIGKRLICTPYVPLSTYRDVLNRIYLVIKDDFCGMKEDTIRDYQVAFLGEQYCVYWGKGPLSVTHLENKEEVSKEELEECAFFDMTTHRMPFNLQPRERKVSRVLVTLILKQKITKKITFPVQYNDVPHENPIAQSTPTGTASSKGKAEPTDVVRGTSKSSQLPEELTRIEHHLETIGSTSTEPADTKGKTMAQGAVLEKYMYVPRENPIAKSTPTGSASSKGKAEPTDVLRGTSKSPQLPEEQTSKHHDLETIGSTSSEPGETKDRSSPTEVLTIPRPLTPPSIESPSCEHAYQETETGAIGEELKGTSVLGTSI
eukprot:XP_011673852.1 PREDICTED: uncharacterized protein LOC105442895 [Strongylocentrotus purpuratus]